jgi:hypothetical protein
MDDLPKTQKPRDSESAKSDPFFFVALSIVDAVLARHARATVRASDPVKDAVSRPRSHIA